MINSCIRNIIPAVIPTSATDLEIALTRYIFAPKLQVDIVDGHFATPASWPYSPAGEPAEAAALCERYEVQVDIMAVDPLAMAEAWVMAGARELVIHIESVADLEAFKALRHKNAIKLWLAGADTLPIETYLPHIGDIDGVQLMGIATIGQQGQTFSERVVENTRALRAAAPQLPIQIDGSVNLSTISNLQTAGATDFVVGSAISASDNPRDVYHALRGLVC